MERAVVFSRDGKLTLRDLPPNVRQETPAVVVAASRGKGAAAVLAAEDLTVKEAEKQLIIRALRESEGNRVAAAKLLGMSRRTLYRKLRIYNLENL